MGALQRNWLDHFWKTSFMQWYVSQDKLIMVPVYFAMDLVMPVFHMIRQDQLVPDL